MAHPYPQFLTFMKKCAFGALLKASFGCLDITGCRIIKLLSITTVQLPPMYMQLYLA